MTDESPESPEGPEAPETTGQSDSPEQAASPGGSGQPEPERKPLPRWLARIDAWQRTRAVPSFLVAVSRKSGDDRARPLSALIAHYAFFSIFPLLLVLVTVIGWVLSDHPALRQEVIDSTVAQFPVIGADLTGNVGAIEGSGIALAIGLVTALWAGIGMGLGLQYAFDTVWAVPRVERSTAVAARASEPWARWRSWPSHWWPDRAPLRSSAASAGSLPSAGSAWQSWRSLSWPPPSSACSWC